MIHYQTCRGETWAVVSTGKGRHSALLRARCIREVHTGSHHAELARAQSQVVLWEDKVRFLDSLVDPAADREWEEVAS